MNCITKNTLYSFCLRKPSRKLKNKLLFIFITEFFNLSLDVSICRLEYNQVDENYSSPDDCSRIVYTHANRWSKLVQMWTFPVQNHGLKTKKVF
jgi:hypothetical protein